jgi:hypothetical protein
MARLRHPVEHNVTFLDIIISPATVLSRSTICCLSRFLNRSCNRSAMNRSASSAMQSISHAARSSHAIDQPTRSGHANGRSVCDSLICLADRLHGRFRKVSRQQIVSKSGSRPMSPAGHPYVRARRWFSSRSPLSIPHTNEILCSESVIDHANYYVEYYH